MQKIQKVLTALAATGFVATSATAAVVNVDFGRNDNTTADAGWNNVSADVGTLATNTTSIADMVDSTGASTGIALNLSYVAGMSAGGGGSDYAGGYPASVAGMPATAISDSFFINAGGLMTAVFSGLDAGMQYEFLFYGARGNNGTDVTWTVTGGNGPFDVTTADVFNNSTDAPVISGVVADGSGEITLVMDGGASGAINVLQIASSPVPEPGSLALLGLGGLALIRRRR